MGKRSYTHDTHLFRNRNYLAPGEYTRGKRFFAVNPPRRVFTAG